MASPASRLFSRTGALRGNRADVAFALFVVAIVGLLVVPVPPPVLDVLLATSLGMAVVVLLVVLYVGDALGIATFPTLLLLTTLYRLALNVSTSRQILLRGYAGEVILAFGSFVVRGNYLVGAIVFAILTIIQFIVIAKGSERVAEVAARFALDAMPGKQMAIDAELRAGAIDAGEARRRRRVLARESQFYGAMDGAMKFVKGDVIAGLVITVVNLVGGLAVGVLQRDMTATDALKKYGLLTIGDGLVTQIPALVMSTAAGLLVTRVSSEEPDSPLGAELGAQLFGNAKALFAAAAFVAMLAVVPGFPALPFLALAVVLALAARARSNALERARKEEASTSAAKGAPRVGGRRSPTFVPIVVPWSVDVAPELAEHLDDRGDAPGLRTRLWSLRESVFFELGLPVPAPRIGVAEGMPPWTAVVSVREIPIDVASTDVPAERLAKDDDLRDAFLDAIVQRARAAIVRRANELLGIGETQLLLDALEEVNPAIVRQLVPKPISPTLLTDVLRRLLEERVSIRDLRTILEGIAPVAVTDKDPLTLSEAARGALGRAITHKLTHGERSLEVLVLDPVIEDFVRSHVTRTATGAFHTLSPSECADIGKSVTVAWESKKRAEGAVPIVVATPDVRRFVKKALEGTPIDPVVVGYTELDPEIALHATRVAPV